MTKKVKPQKQYNDKTEMKYKKNSSTIGKSAQK